MYRLLWKTPCLILGLAFMLLLPRAYAADRTLRVVDEDDVPVKKFEVEIYDGDNSRSKQWTAGKAGRLILQDYMLTSPDEKGRGRVPKQIFNVLVRADGYASTLARFTGQDRELLLRGEAKIVLLRGESVELQFRLPEGLVWPEDLLPEVYFDQLKDAVRTLHSPENRRHFEDHKLPDHNMLHLHSNGPGRFALRLASDTKPFHVAIYSPGFLQQFEAGPFTLADVKQGVLEIELPRPASLDLRVEGTDVAPFSEFFLSVSPREPGSRKRFLTAVSARASSLPQEMKLTDLAPGVYRVFLDTAPKPGVQNFPGTKINPGRYLEFKTINLGAGQTEHIDIRIKPVDPDAFRGNRTAVVRILAPDGSPAAGRNVEVGYTDGQYDWLPVFSGKVPESGEVILKDISEGGEREGSIGPYRVRVDDKPLGFFGFTQDDLSQEFVFRLVPDVGDFAPDVELLNVVTDKRVKLSDLRGKIVLLEFWATWCGPCQPAMHKLSELAREQAEPWRDRVVLVAVSIDDDPEHAKQYVQDRGWDNIDHYWSGAEGSTGWVSPALRAFVGSGVPEAVLIDSEGRILWRGYPNPVASTDGQTVKARVEAALNGYSTNARLGLLSAIIVAAATLIVFRFRRNAASHATMNHQP